MLKDCTPLHTCYSPNQTCPMSVGARGKNMKTVKLCLNDPECCKAVVRYSIFFRPIGLGDLSAHEQPKTS